MTDPIPWIFDLEDRRFNVQMRRRILLALFAAEGIGLGASLGAQAGHEDLAYIGLGAGVGLLTGIGYASLMPGARPAWSRATPSRSRSAPCRTGPLAVAALVAPPRTRPVKADEEAQPMIVPARQRPYLRSLAAILLAAQGAAAVPARRRAT